MELAVVGLIGLAGWRLSAKPAGEPAPLTLDSYSYGRPGNTPISDPALFGNGGRGTSPSLRSAQEAHVRAAEERYRLAAQPLQTGVVAPQDKTPFFKSAKTQSTNDAMKQRRMESHTGAVGLDTSLTGTWQKKSEVQALFVPAPQAITSDGSAGNPPTYLKNVDVPYVSNQQKNVLPTEQVRVGPGLGTNAAATGGFHPFFRVLPHHLLEEHKLHREHRRNINVGGARSGTEFRPADPVVRQNHVPRTFDIRRRPPERGRAAETAQTQRPDVLESLGDCDGRVVGDDYYGPRGLTGHRVHDTAATRDKDDSGMTQPLERNYGRASEGIGAFAGYAAGDTAKIDWQQREQAGKIAAITGDQKRHVAPSTFLMPATVRDLVSSGYGGIAGTHVAARTVGALDTAKTTLRDVQDRDIVGHAARADVKASSVMCTDMQLLKEAKRSTQLVENYVRSPQRTAAFKRTAAGESAVADDAARCADVRLRDDASLGRIMSHAQGLANNSQPALPGGSGRVPNKLTFAHPRGRDFGMVGAQLATNDLHVSISR